MTAELRKNERNAKEKMFSFHFRVNSNFGKAHAMKTPFPVWNNHPFYTIFHKSWRYLWCFYYLCPLQMARSRHLWDIRDKATKNQQRRIPERFKSH